MSDSWQDIASNINTVLQSPLTACSPRVSNVCNAVCVALAAYTKCELWPEFRDHELHLMDLSTGTSFRIDVKAVHPDLLRLSACEPSHRALAKKTMAESIKYKLVYTCCTVFGTDEAEPDAGLYLVDPLCIQWYKTSTASTCPDTKIMGKIVSAVNFRFHHLAPRTYAPGTVNGSGTSRDLNWFWYIAVMARRYCWECGVGASGRGHLKCGGCRTGAYCSKECQRAAWPSHRTVCGKSVALDERCLSAILKELQDFEAKFPAAHALTVFWKREVANSLAPAGAAGLGERRDV